MSDKKLIKLITNDSNAIFDNQFRNEIIIKKDSEIALHSLSMVRQEANIEIQPNNDSISFFIQNRDGNGIQKTFTLPHGRYNVHNIFDLVDNINKLANEQISTLTSGGQTIVEYGSFVQFRINDHDPRLDFPRFEMCCYRPPFSKIRDTTASGIATLIVEKKDITINPILDIVYKATDNSNGALTTSNIHLSKPFIRGFGSFRTRIYHFVASANPNGFTMGLTKDPEKLTNMADPFHQNDIAFGISINQPTGVYTSIINGNATASSINPLKFGAGTSLLEQDIIDITYKGGRMIGTIYQDGTITEIFNEVYTYSKDSFDSYTRDSLGFHNDESLYPFIIFFAGQTNIMLNGTRCHLEERNFIYESADTEGFDHVPNSIANLPVPIPAYNQFDWSVTFPNTNISSFFGFEFLRIINNAEDGRPSVIEGTQQFTVIDTSDIYMVELLNIELDSYEAHTESRKNILAVIPVNENNVNMANFTLQYESPNLNYISIRNEYDLSLRNVRARIVDSRFNPIETNGTSHITLFVKGRA